MFIRESEVINHGSRISLFLDKMKKQNKLLALAHKVTFKDCSKWGLSTVSNVMDHALMNETLLYFKLKKRKKHKIVKLLVLYRL